MLFIAKGGAEGKQQALNLNVPPFGGTVGRQSAPRQGQVDQAVKLPRFEENLRLR